MLLTPEARTKIDTFGATRLVAGATMYDAVNACNYAALCALADLVDVTASDLMGYWVEESETRRKTRAMQVVAFRPSTALGARKERLWARDAKRVGDSQYWNSRAAVHEDFCLDADFYVPDPWRWRRDLIVDLDVAWLTVSTVVCCTYHRSGGQVPVCGNDTYGTACSECRGNFAPTGWAPVTVEQPRCPIRGDVCVRFATHGRPRVCQCGARILTTETMEVTKTDGTVEVHSAEVCDLYSHEGTLAVHQGILAVDRDLASAALRGLMRVS